MSGDREIKYTVFSKDPLGSRNTVTAVSRKAIGRHWIFYGLDPETVRRREVERYAKDEVDRIEPWAESDAEDAVVEVSESLGSAIPE